MIALKTLGNGLRNDMPLTDLQNMAFYLAKYGILHSKIRHFALQKMALCKTLNINEV